MRARRAAFLVLAAAAAAFAAAASPELLQRRLSADGSLDPFTVSRIQYLRFFAAPFSVAALWALLLRRAPARDSLEKLAAFAAVILAASLAWTARANLAMPAFVLAHTETAYYLASLRWAGGLFPYNDPQALPIASIVYTPLFTAVSAGLIKLLGPAVLWPKLAALAASAALLALQWRALSAAGLSRAGKAYGMMTTLAAASPWYLLWARADSLCAFFSLAAILTLISPGATGAAAAAVLAVLAVMSKQTGIFLYPVGLALLWRRRAKRGEFLAFGLVVPAAGLATTWLFDRWSGGYYSFWVNKLMGVLPLKALPALLYDQVPMLLWMALFPALALLLLAGGEPSRLAAEARRGLVSPVSRGAGLALLLGLPMLAVLSSRVGGGDNSYLPLLPLIGIAAGSWFDAWVKAKAEPDDRLRWACAGAFAAAAAAFALYPPLHLHLALLQRSAEVPAMVEELRECAAGGPCEGAAVIRGGSGEGSAYRESPNLVAALAHLGHPLDEEVSLMDYTAAGFAVPERVRKTLMTGGVKAIVVPKGYEPFAVVNHMYWGPIPMDPQRRALYPREVREAFRACYALAKINLTYLDLYVHRGCRWPK